MEIVVFFSGRASVGFVVVFCDFSAFLESLAFVALWLLRLLIPGLLALGFCGSCGFFIPYMNAFRSLLWLLWLL